MSPSHRQQSPRSTVTTIRSLLRPLDLAYKVHQFENDSVRVIRMSIGDILSGVIVLQALDKEHCQGYLDIRLYRHEKYS